MLQIIFLSLLSYSDQLKVAVIDSGFNTAYIKQVNVCKDGLINTTFGTPSDDVSDKLGHGTSVLGTIVKNNKNKDVCFYIIKTDFSVPSYLLALLKAVESDAKIIHISAGGYTPLKIEEYLVKRHLNKTRFFVAAAGNDSLDLNKNCNYYPACLDSRVFMISNKKLYSNKHKDAIIMDKDGEGVEVFGIHKHGTSQSAAYFTAFLLNFLKDHPEWTR